MLRNGKRLRCEREVGTRNGAPDLASSSEKYDPLREPTLHQKLISYKLGMIVRVPRKVGRVSCDRSTFEVRHV